MTRDELEILLLIECPTAEMAVCRHYEDPDWAAEEIGIFTLTTDQSKVYVVYGCPNCGYRTDYDVRDNDGHFVTWDEFHALRELRTRFGDAAQRG